MIKQSSLNITECDEYDQSIIDEYFEKRKYYEISCYGEQHDIAKMLHGLGIAYKKRKSQIGRCFFSLNKEQLIEFLNEIYSHKRDEDYYDNENKHSLLIDILDTLEEYSDMIFNLINKKGN